MKVIEVARKLEQQGWFLSRIRGSHRQFKHTNRRELVTLPGKLSGDVPSGTLHNIFKKARFY
ncbi:MAG TPA: type II toxin-antitoxin system HicA family toxin [Leptolyngbyaceae cyanobacterium]